MILIAGQVELKMTLLTQLILTRITVVLCRKTTTYSPKIATLFVLRK